MLSVIDGQKQISDLISEGWFEYIREDATSYELEIPDKFRFFYGHHWSALFMREKVYLLEGTEHHSLSNTTGFNCCFPNEASNYDELFNNSAILKSEGNVKWIMLVNEDKYFCYMLHLDEGKCERHKGVFFYD